ncbi:MAG TPA: HNH endonuclease signature motif containing protein [Steroidobacteraceae bacterium]|jgi:hypothetical protein
MAGRFWWVNHSRTAQWEIAGGYLWFASGGTGSASHGETQKNIGRAMPGDVVFSFIEGVVGAVGVVLEAAREAARPAEFSSRSEHAGDVEGWCIPVRFATLARPLRTEDHATELKPSLPRTHSPLRANGLCNERVRFAVVPDRLANTLRILLKGQLERMVESISETVGRTLADSAAKAAIQRRTDMGPELKTLLLKAGQGQGLFRENVERTERACRITGLLDRRHLRAIHIKPWFACDDREKLDGFNGLLMSPHVAHLFERGHISFSDSGELLVSEALNPAVLESWGFRSPHNVGSFTPEQRVFLDFHRRRIFGQRGGGRRQNVQDHGEAAIELANAQPPELNAGAIVLDPA